MVLGLTLLCAIDYFGDGKEAKLPGQSRFPLWAVLSGYLQSRLPSAQTLSQGCLPEYTEVP